MQKEFQNLQTFKKFYDHDDPSHDWSHIIRVVKLCEKISTELNQDQTSEEKTVEEINCRILTTAAVLHDVINVPKNSANRSKASLLAANKAKELLADFDYTKNEIEEIAQVIIEHSYSANLPPSSIESKILQDADKLDSMGAIGVMRWNTVGTKMKAKYYHHADPFAEGRELNDKEFSLDHFKTKLFLLFDRLNTDPAKREGQKRLDFMSSFIEQLSSEII